MAVIPATVIIANRGPIEPLQGFEAVGRAARAIVVNGLNDAIDRLQERWRASDAELETYGMDVGIGAAGVEHVSTENVFQGPHKSLVASPISRFPNVSLTAYATRPGPGDALNDRVDVAELSLLVEIMVSAGPIVDGEELFFESLVHRRIERTSEALLAVLRESRNLLATVDRVGQPRGGIVNVSWTRTEDAEGDAGAMYVLHGSRFQYALTRRVSTI